MTDDIIYLDGLATQPILPAARNTLLDALGDFGNANSSHVAGWRAHERIDRAKSNVAALIGADAPNILCLAGATEANALVFATLADFAKEDSRRTLIISGLEHDAVLRPARALQAKGWQLRICRICQDGLIDLNHLKTLIDESVAMVSVMAANNLTGAIQPIEDACNIAKNHGALFHTDAAQAVGKMAIDVASTDIDYLTLSAHKFGGLQGCGALYRSPYSPMILGYDTALSSTAGTPPTALISAMGTAAEDRRVNLHDQSAECNRLFEAFEAEIETQGVPIFPWRPATPRVNGAKAYILSEFASSDMIAYLQNDVCISNASACFSGQIAPPPVLGAMHMSATEQRGFFRIGLGWWNTVDEMRCSARKMKAAFDKVRLATGDCHQ